MESFPPSTTPTPTADREGPFPGLATSVPWSPPPPPATRDAPPAAGPPPGRRVWRTALAISAVALIGSGSGWLAGRAAGDDEAASPAIVETVGYEQTATALDVGAVVDELEPAVVSISAMVRVRQGPFVQEGESAGSGIVLTADGQVLTNAHVVEGATSITVTLGDGTSFAATIVGSASGEDLALLQLDGASGLAVATIGSSSSLEVGDDAIAIGNALALEGGLTVTRGIVSALDRSLDTETGTLDGLIQTDASISSGNSGGPLANGAGEVVGLTTAVATGGATAVAENIGFAIPIDHALEVVAALRGEA